MKPEAPHQEIRKTPECPYMDPELITVLTNLCFQKENPTPSDLLFVFGSNVQHKEIADTICQLLDEQHFQKVLITGGVTNYRGSEIQYESESENILSFIIKEKYEDRVFVIENTSKSILENVIEAQKVFSFENIQSITFISHSYASKRAALCLKRFFPNLTIHCVPLELPSEDPALPVNHKRWYKTRYGQSLVLGEYLRLITYGNRGDFPMDTIQENLDKVQLLLNINQVIE